MAFCCSVQALDYRKEVVGRFSGASFQLGPGVATHAHDETEHTMRYMFWGNNSGRKALPTLVERKRQDKNMNPPPPEPATGVISPTGGARKLALDPCGAPRVMNESCAMPRSEPQWFVHHWNLQVVCVCVLRPASLRELMTHNSFWFEMVPRVYN